MPRIIFLTFCFVSISDNSLHVPFLFCFRKRMFFALICSAYWTSLPPFSVRFARAYSSACWRIKSRKSQFPGCMWTSRARPVVVQKSAQREGQQSILEYNLPICGCWCSYLCQKAHRGLRTVAFLKLRYRLCSWIVALLTFLFMGGRVLALFCETAGRTLLGSSSKYMSDQNKMHFLGISGK